MNELLKDCVLNYFKIVSLCSSSPAALFPKLEASDLMYSEFILHKFDSKIGGIIFSIGGAVLFM